MRDEKKYQKENRTEKDWMSHTFDFICPLLQTLLAGKTEQNFSFKAPESFTKEMVNSVIKNIKSIFNLK